MEENKISKSHKIMLNNRKSGTFTGVLDVISFDISEILLETEQGMLNVKGKDLHVNRLNLEKGEVDVEGMVDVLAYTQLPSGIKKTQGSLLSKLFK